MSKTIRKRNREALAERFERDGADTMDAANWERWVDGPPVGEFMALIDIKTQPERING